MTRKKWNKLRRQRETLYWALPPWETLTRQQLQIVRGMGAAEFINVESAAKLLHRQLPLRVAHVELLLPAVTSPGGVVNASLFQGSERHDWVGKSRVQKVSDRLAEISIDGLKDGA